MLMVPLGRRKREPWQVSAKKNWYRYFPSVKVSIIWNLVSVPVPVPYYTFFSTPMVRGTICFKGRIVPAKGSLFILSYGNNPDNKKVPDLTRSGLSTLPWPVPYVGFGAVFRILSFALLMWILILEVKLLRTIPDQDPEHWCRARQLL